MTCTFRNVGKQPVHLRRLGVNFGWMPNEEWACINANVVVQPFATLLFGQSYVIPVQVPFDAAMGYYKIRVGVDLRMWSGTDWIENEEVQWGKPMQATNDQIAVQYPIHRNFQVFISHSEKDRALADYTADQIRRCGQKPYLAESADNPEVGRKLWAEKITQALTSSNVVLVLWTDNSSSSPAVQKEIEMATTMRKLILPAIAEDVPVPRMFQEQVYVRFKAQRELEAVKVILQSLLNYEAEQRKGQEGGAAIVALLALLIIGGIASSKR